MGANGRSQRSVETPGPLRRNTASSVFRPDDGVVVVLSRCIEKSTTPHELLSRNVPFVVYQKMAGKCNTTASLAQLKRDHGQHALRVRWMNFNRGDECSAYLQFIVDHYSALPRAVAFLQYDSQHQMLNYHSTTKGRRAGSFFGSTADALVAVQAHRMNMSRGFIALGRHSFEGEWPGPCEPLTRASRFRECSAPIAQHVLGRNASGLLRFYGNGKHKKGVHVHCMSLRVCMSTACALHLHGRPFCRRSRAYPRAPCRLVPPTTRRSLGRGGRVVRRTRHARHPPLAETAALGESRPRV